MITLYRRSQIKVLRVAILVVACFLVDRGADRLTLAGHELGVAAVAFSPDGQYVLSGSHDFTVRLWSVPTGTELALLFDRRSAFVDFTEEYPPLDVMAVTFNAVGTLAAAGIRDRTVHIWNVNSREQVAVLRGHKGGVLAVAFSPDSRLIASGGHEDTVRVWDVASGQQLLALDGHLGFVRSVGFSPDGSQLFSSSSDGRVRVWDMGTGHQLNTINLECGPIHALVMSLDGRYWAGCDDWTIVAWNTEGEAKRRVLTGHEGAVMSVALSSDANMLISGGRDDTVRVWETETGRPLHVLRGHEAPVQSVALRADSSLIASGSYDYTIRLWDAARGSLVKVFDGGDGGKP